MVLATVAGLLCLALAGTTFAPGPRTWLRSVYYAHALGTPLLMEVPRQKIRCARIRPEQRMVALAFGQSNAANFADSRSRAEAGVYSFHEGSCYVAVDPMLGADGFGGSVWPRVGAALVRSGAYHDVVFITVGVGGSSVADWAPGGRLHRRLTDSIASARSVGLEVTHMLWHQGERDAAIGTSEAEYVNSFVALVGSLRALGVEAPIYVSTASFCHGRGSLAVRAAQLGLVSPPKRILAGPDTDVLNGSLDRHDGCHFSAHGLDRLTAAWIDALNAAKDGR